MSTPAVTLAQNLHRLRSRRPLSLRQLAARLEEIGHPVGADALNRIEMGKRQATVTDLVALALALDVSPLALLLPASDQPVQLTPEVRTGWRPAWLWAVGEIPRPPVERVDGNTRTFERIDLADPKVAEHIKANRPFEDPSLVRELGRMLLARLSGQPFVMELAHSGDGQVRGSITITGEDGGHDGECQ